MKIKNRVKILVIVIIAIISSVFFACFVKRPVKIVAVHHRSSGFSDVLVTHFPITDRGKIHWWLKNKDILKNQYGTPKNEYADNFNINFWLFGDGYMKEDKYERLCFDDMKTEQKCIDKNKVFSVSKSFNGSVNLMVYDGIYGKNGQGKWVKKRFAMQ